MSGEEYCRKCGCGVFECGGNVTGACIRRPVPSPQPEDVAALEAYLTGLPVAVVKAALLGCGLHIVGPAERYILQQVEDGAIDNPEGVFAELARRGSQ